MATVAKETSLKSAFALCDDILKQAVEGISDLITNPGIINVDFADIRAVMENAGSALMGIGIASGENRASVAAQAAVSSPLLEISINGAKGVLFAIAGGEDLGMIEVHEAAKIITESVDPNARIIFGAIKDDKLKKNEVRVTVIATGFPTAALQGRGGPQLFPARETKELEPELTPLVGRMFSSPVPPSPITPAAPTPIVPKEEKKEKEREPERKLPELEVKQKKEDEDDEWGAVPSFLRRPKIK